MVFVVMADQRPVLREVAAPVSFRFSDPNPLTSGAYAQSKFRDLRAFAGAVVEDRLGMCAGEWDVLVEDGEVYDFVGPNEVFELRRVTEKTCTRCSGSGTSARTDTGRCSDCGGVGRYGVLDEAGTAAVERAETLAWSARHRTGAAA